MASFLLTPCPPRLSTKADDSDRFPPGSATQLQRPDRSLHFVVRADEQEIERVAVVAEDDPQMEPDPELVETARKFTQSQVSVGASESRNQRRDGFKNLALYGCW